jgi:hypothetical protein
LKQGMKKTEGERVKRRNREQREQTDEKGRGGGGKTFLREGVFAERGRSF